MGSNFRGIGEEQYGKGYQERGLDYFLQKGLVQADVKGAAQGILNQQDDIDANNMGVRDTAMGGEMMTELSDQRDNVVNSLMSGMSISDANVKSLLQLQKNTKQVDEEFHGAILANKERKASVNRLEAMKATRGADVAYIDKVIQNSNENWQGKMGPNGTDFEIDPTAKGSVDIIGNYQADMANAVTNFKVQNKKSLADLEHKIVMASDNETKLLLQKQLYDLYSNSAAVKGVLKDHKSRLGRGDSKENYYATYMDSSGTFGAELQHQMDMMAQQYLRQEYRAAGGSASRVPEPSGGKNKGEIVPQLINGGVGSASPTLAVTADNNFTVGEVSNGKYETYTDDFEGSTAQSAKNTPQYKANKVIADAFYENSQRVGDGTMTGEEANAISYVRKVDQEIDRYRTQDVGTYNKELNRSLGTVFGSGDSPTIAELQAVGTQRGKGLLLSHDRTLDDDFLNYLIDNQDMSNYLSLASTNGLAEVSMPSSSSQSYQDKLSYLNLAIEEGAAVGMVIGNNLEISQDLYDRAKGMGKYRGKPEAFAEKVIGMKEGITSHLKKEYSDFIGRDDVREPFTVVTPDFKGVEVSKQGTLSAINKYEKFYKGEILTKINSGDTQFKIIQMSPDGTRELVGDSEINFEDGMTAQSAMQVAYDAVKNGENPQMLAPNQGISSLFKEDNLTVDQKISADGTYNNGFIYTVSVPNPKYIASSELSEDNQEYNQYKVVVENQSFGPVIGNSVVQVDIPGSDVGTPARINKVVQALGDKIGDEISFVGNTKLGNIKVSVVRSSVDTYGIRFDDGKGNMTRKDPSAPDVTTKAQLGLMLSEFLH